MTPTASDTPTCPATGQPLRIAEIEGVPYVSVEDFSQCIRETVSTLLALVQQQQAHTEAVSKVTEVYDALLEERYPAIRAELMEAAGQRLNAA